MFADGTVFVLVKDGSDGAATFGSATAANRGGCASALCCDVLAGNIGAAEPTTGGSEAIGAALFSVVVALALRRDSNSLSLRSNCSIRSSRMRSRSLTSGDDGRLLGEGVGVAVGVGCWVKAAP